MLLRKVHNLELVSCLVWGLFHLIFLEHGWLWATETTERKTVEKGGTTVYSTAKSVTPIWHPSLIAPPPGTLCILFYTMLEKHFPFLPLRYYRGRSTGNVISWFGPWIESKQLENWSALVTASMYSHNYLFVCFMLYIWKYCKAFNFNFFLRVKIYNLGRDILEGIFLKSKMKILIQNQGQGLGRHY